MDTGTHNLDQVEVCLQWIGPHEAKDLLQANNCNRSVRKNAVEQYAAEMQQGEWHLGCDAIGFDETGTLINGQHRLYAVIQSEKAFPFLVARNLPRKSRDSLDVGKKRQLHERITIAGYAISAKEASICNQLITPWDYETRIAVNTKDMRERIVRIHQRFKPSIELVMKHKMSKHYITELAAGVFIAEYFSRIPDALISSYDHDGDPLQDFLHLVTQGTRKDGTLLPQDGALKVYRESKINAIAKNKRVTNMDYYQLVVSAAYKYVEGIPAKGMKAFKSNPFIETDSTIQQILAS